MTADRRPWARHVSKILRRTDGEVHLRRWGFEVTHLGGIFVHRIDANEPGPHLHDHPWWFTSLVLAGSYVEERAGTRDATFFARMAENYPGACHYGHIETRPRWSLKAMRLDECHRIVAVDGPVWTLLVHGPHRGRWGFFTRDGWVEDQHYDNGGRVTEERR